ncbi:MAG: SPASM domain-containing protein [Roseomonas sp.]|nr:SPASM domain-containing protein [Roseomonas sp.]MCA3420166.1 SPASM domain-containing protein [Roseomonas sp.]MCA3427568.1 SPASM domain-containing protein [Roseomonas sp.]
MDLMTREKLTEVVRLGNEGRFREAEAITRALLRRDRDQRESFILHFRLKRRRHEALRQHLQEQRGAEIDFLPRRLTFVALGTTGLCNASCMHCPTGKTTTDQMPRVPMPLPLFESIMRQIDDLGIILQGQISFGLFGDALLDPHVQRRVQFVRETLPEASISINTNGAAYDRARHSGIAEEQIILALHCESLKPDVYGILMQPLQFQRVLPKIEQILADFGSKVLVSVPVTRLNRDELPAIDAFFRQRGVGDLGFDIFSSRCAEERTVFETLALAPVKNRCGPDVHEQLIVDCDGKVLICCNDFRRVEVIGDLARQNLLDVLLHPERRRMVEQFATGRENERSSCSACYCDQKIEGIHGRGVQPATEKSDTVA